MEAGLVMRSSERSLRSDSRSFPSVGVVVWAPEKGSGHQFEKVAAVEVVVGRTDC